MKRFKKAICILGAMMCLLGSTVTASAQTIDFNVTPPGDKYSYAAKKADTEQYFYVTATSFNKAGALTCYSQQIDNGEIISRETSVGISKLSSNAGYKSYAAAYKDYQMVTRASVSGLNVKGRYTP